MSGKQNTQNLMPKTPSPWEFQQLAEGSFDAANAAYAECQERDKLFNAGKKNVKFTFMSISVAFLYFRAIELSLKAAILQRNLATPKAIPSKKLGHDIKKLIACATTPVAGKSAYSLRELGLNARDKAYIESKSDDYANKWFEYNFGPWDIPCLEKCQKITSMIMAAIKPIAKTPPPINL